MNKYKAVIGANFGDEGKGMAIARIAKDFSNKKTLGVRFNGGFQAGHTVEIEGCKHIFKGFSSGTFFGVDTFFSEDFIFNPMYFYNEKKHLNLLGYNPKIKMSKKTKFQIPLDAFINMTIEERRGKERHGSIGIGIFETIKRIEKESEFTSFYDFMTNCTDKIKWFANINANYLPSRLKELNIDESSFIGNTDFIFSQLELIELLRKFLIVFDSIEFIEFEELEKEYELILFEGAQGLMLDQNNMEYFPNLTPSNCGIKNITKMLKDGDFLEVYYATRPYLTRHGAGRLDWEVEKSVLNSKIVDLTNIPNKWQESLRFGVLDIETFMERIKKDLGTSEKELELIPFISISCLDQIPENGMFVYNENSSLAIKVDSDEFIELFEKKSIQTKYNGYSNIIL